MSFRWNQGHKPVHFWDPNHDGGRGQEITKNLSDRDLISNHGQAWYEDTIRALCHVVAELVEIEEKRAESKGLYEQWLKQTSNPPDDQL